MLSAVFSPRRLPAFYGTTGYLTCETIKIPSLCMLRRQHSTVVRSVVLLMSSYSQLAVADPDRREDPTLIADLGDECYAAVTAHFGVDVPRDVMDDIQLKILADEGQRRRQRHEESGRGGTSMFQALPRVSGADVLQQLRASTAGMQFVGGSSGRSPPTRRVAAFITPKGVLGGR